MHPNIKHIALKRVTNVLHLHPFHLGDGDEGRVGEVVQWQTFPVVLQPAQRVATDPMPLLPVLDCHSSAGGIVLHFALNAGPHGSCDGHVTPHHSNVLPLAISHITTQPGSSTQPVTLSVQGLPDFRFTLKIKCGKPELRVYGQPVVFVVEAPTTADPAAAAAFRSKHLGADGAFIGPQQVISIHNAGNLPLEVDFLPEQQHEQQPCPPAAISCSNAHQLPLVIEPPAATTGWLMFGMARRGSSSRELQLCCTPKELVYGREATFDLVLSTNIAAQPLQTVQCRLDCKGPQLDSNTAAVHLQQQPGQSHSRELTITNVGNMQAFVKVEYCSSSSDSMATAADGFSMQVLRLHGTRRPATVLPSIDQPSAGHIVLQKDQQLHLQLDITACSKHGCHQSEVLLTCLNGLSLDGRPVELHIPVQVQVSSTASSRGSNTDSSSSLSLAGLPWGSVPTQLLQAMVAEAGAGSPDCASRPAAQLCDMLVAALLAAQLPAGGPTEAEAAQWQALLRQPAAMAADEQRLLCIGLLLGAGVTVGEVQELLHASGKAAQTAARPELATAQTAMLQHLAAAPEEQLQAFTSALLAVLPRPETQAAVHGLLLVLDTSNAGLLGACSQAMVALQAAAGDPDVATRLPHVFEALSHGLAATSSTSAHNAALSTLHGRFHALVAAAGVTAGNRSSDCSRDTTAALGMAHCLDTLQAAGPAGGSGSAPKLTADRLLQSLQRLGLGPVWGPAMQLLDLAAAAESAADTSASLAHLARNSFHWKPSMSCSSWRQRETPALVTVLQPPWLLHSCQQWS